MSNKDSSQVPKAMMHALASPSPKYRYRVGFDSKYVVTILEKLSEATQDSLMTTKRINPVNPADAPMDGHTMAAARYQPDRTLWFGGALAVALGAWSIRSRL